MPSILAKMLEYELADRLATRIARFSPPESGRESGRPLVLRTKLSIRFVDFPPDFTKNKLKCYLQVHDNWRASLRHS